MLYLQRPSNRNASFYGVTQSTMNKLQRVQNNLARVVCDVGWRQAHSADLLRDLHWLPVHKRVMFKAASPCYRSCMFGQPAYLPLSSYIPARHLRSSNSEPLARIAIGERRFSHSTWHASGTLCRRLSDPLTVTTPSRPG